MERGGYHLESFNINTLEMEKHPNERQSLVKLKKKKKQTKTVYLLSNYRFKAYSTLQG